MRFFDVHHCCLLYRMVLLAGLYTRLALIRWRGSVSCAALSSVVVRPPPIPVERMTASFKGDSLRQGINRRIFAALVYSSVLTFKHIYIYIYIYMDSTQVDVMHTILHMACATANRPTNSLQIAYTIAVLYHIHCSTSFNFI